MAAIPELKRWTVPDQRQASIENARREIGREIAGLIDGRLLPVDCPREITDSAQLAVDSGFPLWAAVQAYRTGHAIQWEAWSDAVESRRLDQDARRALLQAGSEYMFAYADRCSRWIELQYTRERDRRLRGEEQLRIQLVRDLLEGKGGDSAQLGYDLEGWHVALIASGRETSRVLHDLSGRLGTQLLAVAADGFTSWAWVGVPRSRADDMDRQLRSLPLPAGASLAIGEAAEGPAGFRQSHLQARYAAAICARRGGGITRYDDVALEALAMADLEQAQWFVARELGPLAADERRAETLRRTLETYFASAQRASSTAAVLGVHERTIGNRLRAAEQLIGRSVSGRRAELETGLRIHRLLQEDGRRPAPADSSWAQ